jgi:hypothetical protein
MVGAPQPTATAAVANSNIRLADSPRIGRPLRSFSIIT